MQQIWQKVWQNYIEVFFLFLHLIFSGGLALQDNGMDGNIRTLLVQHLYYIACDQAQLGHHVGEFKVEDEKQ